MDRSLPDRSSAETATRRECTAHGDYVAQRLFADHFTRCPTCTRELEQKRAARQAEQQRQVAEERAAATLDSNLRNSGLIGRFKRATFDSFEAHGAGQCKALEACRSFASTFEPSAGGGLWLIGPPGTGKTHLGAAMVSHAIRERRVGAAIHAAHDIMRMLRERFGVKESADPYGDDIDTTDQLIRHLGTVPLLVLDEIGVTRGSDWEAEQMFAIVDERYRLELPTVVVSNLPAAEIKQLVGDRVYDRLREGAKVVPMNWPSHRGSRS